MGGNVRCAPHAFERCRPAAFQLLARGGNFLKLFAERVHCRDVWEKAMEGFSMIESPLIADLLAKAEAQAAAKARGA